MLKGDVWDEYIKPSKVFGNSYFIGIRAVCTHLIDTGDGLIIIDPGYFESLHIIQFRDGAVFVVNILN